MLHCHCSQYKSASYQVPSVQTQWATSHTCTPSPQSHTFNPPCKHPLHRDFADSKTLTEAKRESLFEEINADATLAHDVESLSAATISAEMLSPYVCVICVQPCAVSRIPKTMCTPCICGTYATQNPPTHTHPHTHNQTHIGHK